MLSILTTFRDMFDTIGVSETAVVRVLAYFMGGNVKDVLIGQFVLVEVDFQGGFPEK